jgi:hypothetical protein
VVLDGDLRKPAQGVELREAAWDVKEKSGRDSSVRDPAHKNRAPEKAGSLRSE